MRRFTAIFLSVAMGLTLSSVTAQDKFDYSAIREGAFVPKSVYGVRSMSSGESYTTQSEGKVLQFSYRTGEQTAVLFDQAETTPSIDFSSYVLSADEQRILLTTDVKPIYRRSFTANYWVYDRPSGKLTPLSEGGAQQVATLSPDGSKVAFVRENNLFVVDLATSTERQITSDGRFNHIINGAPDWVYEEEFGFSRAFEWSPNSEKIAYLRFDESRVREYPMNRFDQDELYPTVYSFKYPKAGEQNSIVELYCYDLRSGDRVKVDVGEETDQYIPRIGWTPNNNLLAYRLNRPQNQFDLLMSDEQGATQPIYQESNERYVGGVDYQYITFLGDGDRFVVRTEREGYMHLYLYSISEGLLNPITSGEWEVVSVLGIEGDRIYYTSTESSPLKRDLYSVKLNGKAKTRITGGDGTYRIEPSKGFAYYISYFTNTATPNRVTLHTADGALVRVLEDNAELEQRLAELEIPQKEFFTFTTPQGVDLNGYMIRPADFDSTKTYPVMMVQYSGPGSQRVADSWAISWDDLLVQKGYIIACVDGRGTGLRGAEFKKCTYGQLGKYEVEDQISTARYLGSLPYVDASRIGIFGWSFGGFMALNCILKGNDVFALAIAGAPVTSWRYYDTIYTEAFNGDPNTNPEGYDQNSPIHFADRLKGKLLIAHGTGDDNVHVQNTYEMVTRLSAANKPFEMCIYPDQNHSMGSGRHHLMERCTRFVLENL